MDINAFIANALAEDLGTDGDQTSLACISEGSTNTAHLLVKENGVLAGVGLAKEIFAVVDQRLAIKQVLQDGDAVRPGDVAFYVSGPSRGILSAERLVLNCMQRMSGIATVTRKYANAISHTKARVLDTRKTTPGLRYLEKEAVKIGGGENHRFGLFDMVLIKDNHIDACGGITNALEKTRAYQQKKGTRLRVEIETRNMAEIEEALACGIADRIMLDNFTPAETKAAVEFINGRVETESSGGITLETIASYAECGVDYISVGALTHSVKSLDLSLKIQ